MDTAVGAFGDRIIAFLKAHPNLIPLILKLFGLTLMADGTVKALPEAAPRASDTEILAEAAKVGGPFLDFIKMLIANPELLKALIDIIKGLFNKPAPAPIPPNPVPPNA